MRSAVVSCCSSLSGWEVTKNLVTTPEFAASASSSATVAAFAPELAREDAGHSFLPPSREIIEVISEGEHGIAGEGGGPAGGYPVERNGLAYGGILVQHVEDAQP